jgi:aspartyl-tRNA(Asn)/glutamyl-tRNA(Gln) amidotransferase subunit A
VARAVADDPARFTATERTGAPRLGSLTPAPAYLHAQHVRDDATGRLAAMFTGLDVIALPVTPEPAPGRGTTGDSRLQIPWTLCGFPALALPAGLTPDGLPLAVQFVAPRDHEPALLSAACWSEQALSLRLTPPGVRS